MPAQKVRSSGNVFKPGDIIRGPAGWVVVTGCQARADHVECDTYPVDEHMARLETENQSLRGQVADLSANLTRVSTLLDEALDEVMAARAALEAYRKMPAWKVALKLIPPIAALVLKLKRK